MDCFLAKNVRTKKLIYLMPLSEMSENWDDLKRPALHDGFSKKKARTENQLGLRKLTATGRAFTRCTDEVHESIDICPVMKVLIDTKHFQRLRYIRQLGTTYQVYPTANHTRFEHSLGVAHLAKRMAERIQEFQSYLGTTDKDILCITIAGLLHDVGHGCYSHLYEDFRGAIERDIKHDEALQKKYKQYEEVDKEWSHERSSLATIDAILRSLGQEIDLENLDKPLKQIGFGFDCVDARTMRVFNGNGSYEERDEDDKNEILTSRDWIFIKECIFGEPIPKVKEKFGNRRIGRLDDKKEWMFHVVSNSYSGLDVDKIDYFARDERRSLGEAGIIKVATQDEARVAKAKCPNETCKKCNRGGYHYMICYPEKCVEAIIEFYRVRYKMHTTVYQHKTGIASGQMLVDILKKADLHCLMTTRSGKKLPISRAVLDEEAFYSLKDTIIDRIVESTSEELREARELAHRFIARKLYSKSKCYSCRCV